MRVSIMLGCLMLLFYSCSNRSSNKEQPEENSYIREARKAGKLLTGKVIAITDGDTFRLLAEDHTNIRVRLHGVDAPEKGQDYGTQARQKLSELIFSKQIAVIQKSKDRYGRIVGITYTDNVNVNEALLQEGLVWHYKDYDKNPDWAAMEEAAREEKLGLWSKSRPVPPWQWRKKKRASSNKTVEAD